MIKQILLIGRGANVILGMFMSFAHVKKEVGCENCPDFIGGHAYGGRLR
jgi:hypothetical protein